MMMMMNVSSQTILLKFQPHSSVNCWTEIWGWPNCGVEPQSSYELCVEPHSSVNPIVRSNYWLNYGVEPQSSYDYDDNDFSGAAAVNDDADADDADDAVDDRDNYADNNDNKMMM